MAPRRSSAQHKEMQTITDPELLLVPPDAVPQDKKESYWLQLVNDLPTLRETVKNVPFFKLVHDLPRALWEKYLMIYAYRLEPRVKNDSKERYMEKIAQVVDEDYFKQEHGGGKYWLLLKCGEETIKEITFAIDGQPKIRPGVALVDEHGNPIGPVMVPPQAQESELRQVVESMSDATGKVGDMLKKGYEGIIDAQNDVLKKNLGVNPAAPAGTPSITDRFLEAAMDKMLNPAPAPDPMEMVTKVLNFIKEVTPKPPAVEPVHSGDLGGGLAIIKEFFDVESIHELGDKLKGKGGFSWGEVIQTAVQNLPNVLAQFSQMQRENFERAIWLRRSQQDPNAPPPRPAP